MTRVVDLIAIARDALAEGRDVEARGVIDEAIAAAVPVAEVVPRGTDLALRPWVARMITHPRIWSITTGDDAAWTFVTGSAQSNAVAAMAEYSADIRELNSLLGMITAPRRFDMPADVAIQLGVTGATEHSSISDWVTLQVEHPTRPTHNDPQPQTFRPGERDPGARSNPPPVPRWAKRRLAARSRP